MRPRSIELFEKLYLGAAGVGLLNALVNYGALREQAVATGTAAATPLLGAAIGLGINLLFWFFIARRASNVAKWIMTVMTALGLVSLGLMWSVLGAYGPVYLTLNAVTTALQVAALVCLFRADAAAWLKSKGKDAPIDPTVFN